MTGTWNQEHLIADGFERVYVELEWYDGPRLGLADINGKPHYFQSHDYADEPVSTRSGPRARRR